MADSVLHTSAVRELTSEEIELVSGGKGPGIWGDPDYAPGGRFNPRVSPAQEAADMERDHHIYQAVIWGAAGAFRGGPLGAAVGAAAGFVSSFL